MMMKDMDFDYRSKGKYKKIKGKILGPEIVINIGFWIETGNDSAYLCELEKREEGWDLYIHYEGKDCHLRYLDNLSHNSQKIINLLDNRYNDGMAIAVAVKEIYQKVKGVIN